MNWNKLKSIADFLGTLAVILTLVYMAIEIRQNTATLKASTSQAELDASIQTLSVIRTRKYTSVSAVATSCCRSLINQQPAHSLDNMLGSYKKFKSSNTPVRSSVQ